MSYYDREILCELENIPTPELPGVLIVTGESQAVFTGENPGEVFLAACEIGNGKVFVSAHDCYLDWLNEKDDDLKVSFMRNVKKWLTGKKNLNESQIIDLEEIQDEIEQVNEYSLAKWHQDLDLDDEQQEILLEYVNNGGALICGATAWGYLQVYPERTLNDMSLFNFLKRHTGIILTEDILSLSAVAEVCKNQAKRSHLDLALSKISHQPEKILKYSNTIQLGLKNIHDNEKMHEIKDLVMKHCDSDKLVPSCEHRLKDSVDKNMAKLVGKCLCMSEGEKAPGVKEFPGDFDQPLELLDNVEVNLSTKFEERLSTGYYLPAGEKLKVKVVHGSDLSGWSVRVGAHCDDLSECEDDFSRWPCVTVFKTLMEEVELFSPFGGLVYLESPNCGGELRVSLSRVVEAPFFDLTKPESVESWRERRNAPGLWAEIGGENIIFTSPSKAIRDLDEPERVMRFWDAVVRTHHECRGSEVSAFRRERVVNDVQPSVGYMHSGYPIVTHLDCCEADYDNCIYDIEKLNTVGCWGLFHEIGHNLQRDEWTFEGAEEVTVNIFSMHAFETLLGQKVTEIYWLHDQKNSLKIYFSKKQPNYDDFKEECCVAIFLFAQLIKNFGWEPMWRFMREYEQAILTQTNLPKKNQDKIDQWVVRYSRIIGKNITAHFRMFGLPVSNKIDSELKKFPTWCSKENQNPFDFFN